VLTEIVGVLSDVICCFQSSNCTCYDTNVVFIVSSFCYRVRVFIISDLYISKVGYAREKRIFVIMRCATLLFVFKKENLFAFGLHFLALA